MSDFLNITIRNMHEILANCHFETDNTISTGFAIQKLDKILPFGRPIYISYAPGSLHHTDPSNIINTKMDRLYAVMLLESIGGRFDPSEFDTINKAGLLPDCDLCLKSDSHNPSEGSLAISRDELDKHQIFKGKQITLDMALNRLDFNVFYTHDNLEDYRLKRSPSRPDPKHLISLTFNLRDVESIPLKDAKTLVDIFNRTYGSGIITSDGRVRLWIDD